MPAPLSVQDWIAIAAHRLAHRWPHVPADQLDEVAADLWADETMRALPPAEAAELWLRPLDEDVVHRLRA